MYGSSYADEADRDDEAWREGTVGPNHQVFGLEVGAELVGIAGVFVWRDDPAGETAFLGMGFIERAYRGRGRSKLLLDARLAWARADGRFRRAVIYHRDGNTAVERLVRGRGFALAERRPFPWHDGGTGDILRYELALR
jgi:GNAT superfamily N-acetyltransferase